MSLNNWLKTKMAINEFISTMIEYFGENDFNFIMRNLDVFNTVYIYLFFKTRMLSDEDIEQIYRVIEEVKNGYNTSGKNKKGEYEYN